MERARGYDPKDTELNEKVKLVDNIKINFTFKANLQMGKVPTDYTNGMRCTALYYQKF